MANSFKISGEYKLERIPLNSMDAGGFFTILESDSEYIKSQNKFLTLNYDNDAESDLKSGLIVVRDGTNDSSIVWDESLNAWVFVGDGDVDVNIHSVNRSFKFSADNIFLQDLRYPNNDGSEGFYLRTDGNGVLDFAEIDLEEETSGHYAKTIRVFPPSEEQITSGLILTPNEPDHASDYVIGVDDTVIRTVGDQNISGEKTFNNKSFFNDDVTINADFYVEGTITSISKEDLLIKDNRIVLNSDTLTGNALGIDSGIEIMRGAETQVEIKWVESQKKWMLTGGKRDTQDFSYHKIVTTDDYGDGNGIDADTLDGEHGYFYRNAGNLNDGILLGDRFDDSSHGERIGGNLHALATPTTAGFMSSDDKTTFDDLDNIYIRHYDAGNIDSTEIGKSLDFHTTDSVEDYDVRLDCTNDSNLSVLGGTLTVDGGVIGNSTSADIWKTARTLSLTGDVSGSISLDGSSDVTIDASLSRLSKSNYPPIYEIVDQDSSGDPFKGYLMDISSVGITFTLPSSPAVGDWIILGDYNGFCSEDTPITITSDDKIHGTTEDLVLFSSNVMISLSYIDSTIGWKIIDGMGENGGEATYISEPITTSSNEVVKNNDSGITKLWSSDSHTTSITLSDDITNYDMINIVSTVFIPKKIQDSISFTPEEFLKGDVLATCRSRNDSEIVISISKMLNNYDMKVEKQKNNFDGNISSIYGIKY